MACTAFQTEGLSIHFADPKEPALMIPARGQLNLARHRVVKSAQSLPMLLKHV